MTDYQWDDKKRLKNIKEHGYDFTAVPQFFSKNHTRKRAHDGGDGEERWMAIGILHEFYATAIYTMRGESVRMISLRKASRNERRYHQEIFG